MWVGGVVKPKSGGVGGGGVAGCLFLSPGGVWLWAGSAAHPWPVPSLLDAGVPWILAQRPWIVPIPGTTKLHRLKENIGAAGVVPALDDLREIEDALPEAQGARYSEAAQRMIDR
jgi:hypothetical protein